MHLDVRVVAQQITNLLLAYPELDDDEILRADMVEGSTDAHDLLRQIEHKRRDATVTIAALDAFIADLKERQARFERREKAMRELVLKIMNAADTKRVEIPEATFSITRGRPKLIGDGDPHTLPDELCTISRSLNRTAIKAALEAGETVPEFTLSNSEPHLTVRTR